MSSTAEDLLAKVVSVAIPNVVSGIGCANAGDFTINGCCKAAEEPCPYPLPKPVWHGALFAANAATGYGDYLIWKYLGRCCIGHRQHVAYLGYLASAALQPNLMKKCDKWGCAPAMLNSLAGCGLAIYTWHLWKDLDRNAGYCMIPGIALALLRAGCTICCATKKCGKGACCPSESKK